MDSPKVFGQMKDVDVLQVVVEESMLKALMADWEASHKPASLSTSCQLSSENFCRLRHLASVSGAIFRHKLPLLMTACVESNAFDHYNDILQYRARVRKKPCSIPAQYAFLNAQNCHKLYSPDLVNLMHVRDPTLLCHRGS